MKRSIFTTILIFTFVAAALSMGLNAFASPAPVMGNTNGNLNNGGRVCEYEGWIYYTTNDVINRMSADGRIVERVVDNPGSDLNIYNDRIYYNDWQDGFVHSMRLDGSDNLIIRDVRSWKLLVADGWLYHAYYAGDGLNGSLQRTSLSSGETESLRNSLIWTYIYADRIIYHDGAQHESLTTSDGSLTLRNFSAYLGNAFYSASYMNISDGWLRRRRG